MTVYVRRFSVKILVTGLLILWQVAFFLHIVSTAVVIKVLAGRAAELLSFIRMT